MMHGQKNLKNVIFICILVVYFTTL